MSKTINTDERFIQEEVWKGVPGFGGHYQVSSFGRVQSKDRVVVGLHRAGVEMTRVFRGKVLSAHTMKRGGYLAVNLKVAGKGTTVLVHRLVLLAFYGEPKPGQECCHGNGNSSDNRAENLRWGTCQENRDDRLVHGTMPRGDQHANAKISEAQALAIISGELSQSAAGICRQQYGRIRRGINWRHLHK